MPVHDRVDLVRVERVDVDVRHARVAALLAARGRPAGNLKRLEAVRGRPRGRLLERRAAERGRQQSELHSVTSTQVWSRLDCATASASTFSTWPARKVG